MLNDSNRLILVADDDAAQRLLLKMSLEQADYRTIEAASGKEALDLLTGKPEIRLIITDLNMPEMDGFELIRQIRQLEYRYTYIIVLTSNDEQKNLIRALRLGADDYLTKPVLSEELRLRLAGAARLLRLESQEALILSMAKLAEYRSRETGYHLERVRLYTKILATDLCEHHPEMGLTIQKATEISEVSTLHDLGKIAIPDHILHKPGRLEKEEFDIMKTHASLGGDILLELYEKTGSSYLKVGYEIARHHHEKWDGSGYPDKLQGDEIPVSARIMALADVYDAMSSKRCYKESYRHDAIKKIIAQESGSHFDPRVVKAFFRQEDIWISVYNRLKDQ